MAKILKDVSRTFSEYLILPGLTKFGQSSDQVSLKTPISKFNKKQKAQIEINVPVVSSAMQAVSCPNLAIALAMNGGICSIHCSQTIENQAEMIKTVKKYKAGFVKSSANISINGNLAQIRKIVSETNHSTIAVTSTGTAHGKFLGIIFAKDIWPGESGEKKVEELVEKNMHGLESVDGKEER